MMVDNECNDLTMGLICYYSRPFAKHTSKLCVVVHSSVIRDTIYVSYMDTCSSGMLHVMSAYKYTNISVPSTRKSSSQLYHKHGEMIQNLGRPFHDFMQYNT